MSETASSQNLPTKVEVRNLFHLGLVIVFGIFATTLPLPFGSLVFLNAGTTAIVLLLVPLLPATLMLSKDRAAM